MIWEVQVCGTCDFHSSALNNVAILGTREKIIEWIRRLAKVFVWFGQRAWARGCVGACRIVAVWSLRVILWNCGIPLGVFAKCWDFPTIILCIKIKNVNRTASQSQTLICFFEWRLHFWNTFWTTNNKYVLDSADESRYNQNLNVLIHYCNMWRLWYWMLVTRVAGYDNQHYLNTIASLKRLVGWGAARKNCRAKKEERGLVQGAFPRSASRPLFLRWWYSNRFLRLYWNTGVL